MNSEMLMTIQEIGRNLPGPQLNKTGLSVVELADLSRQPDLLSMLFPTGSSDLACMQFGLKFALRKLT